MADDLSSRSPVRYPLTTMEVLVPYPGRRTLSQLRLLSSTSFPSVDIIPPNGGAALLRRQSHAPKKPYGVKEVTTKKTPVTTAAAATM